jgi:hypothetical protein
MVKPLRDIMKKPKWAQSKTADKFAKAQPVNRVRNDRGSEHEKNFTADYVPVYDRSAHNQGYPADNSGEYNQSGPPVSECRDSISRAEADHDKKKREGQVRKLRDRSRLAGKKTTANPPVSESTKEQRQNPTYWKGRLACKKPMKKREKPVYDDSPITPNSVEPVRKGSLRPSKQMIDTWNKRFK